MDARLSSLDTETDSPNPEDARIITATILFVGGGLERADRSWLLKPERDIPAEATAIHHITTEYARKHGQDRYAALSEITEQIAQVFRHATPLVIFNSAYDLTVLDREARRVGVMPVEDRLPKGALYGPVLDPMVIDKQVDKYRSGKRTLGAMCAHYDIDLGNAHDATADALGAARLMHKLGKRYPVHVGDRSPELLHALQIDWRAEQQASLAKHFAKQGKTGDVPDGAWPLKFFTPADAAEAVSS